MSSLYSFEHTWESKSVTLAGTPLIKIVQQNISSNCINWTSRNGLTLVNMGVDTLVQFVQCYFKLLHDSYICPVDTDFTVFFQKSERSLKIVFCF